MKSYLIIIVVLLFGISCRKENSGPLENYTDEYVFDPLDKNGIAAQQVLANIYADMPTGFNRIGGDLLDAATDDALPSRNGSSIQAIINGDLNSSSHPDGSWADNYAGIRKVNVFLSKIDVVPNAAVPVWKAEARFLRAYFYFELLKRYGGVPLIANEIFEPTSAISVPRSSFEDVVSYIVTECDIIKGQLRAEPIATGDFGKASRGAAIALKSRVLLYAASPLYNGGVPNEASASQKTLMGYSSFDPERWNKAAQAANELLLLNVYPLETAFNNVFHNRRNNEVILSYLRGTTTDVEVNNGPVGYKENGVGNGVTSPTQELVNSFPMLNGKPIADPTSGYIAATPYNNRDPRLASTIIYNGLGWLNRSVETFEGGLDKPNRDEVQTKTSYYLRKFLGNFSTATQYSAQNHNFVLFRSAEIMLNYAEALNEYSGNVTAVSTMLINLRKRAGITAGTDSRYGIPSGLTKDQMRDVIRNERRIELAFEEHRYWDLRRWKLADQLLNKNLSGLSITKEANGSFTYRAMTAGRIRFIAPKMYYYAIPFSEIAKNNKLIQNYGW